MDKLESYIEENRASFLDDQEVRLGHFDRFDAKLEKRFAKKKRMTVFQKLVSLAGIAILLLSIGIGFGRTGFTEEPDIMSLNAEQMAEIEQELTIRIHDNLGEINMLANASNTSNISETVRMVRQLENEYHALKKEQQSYGNNAPIESALRQNLMARADILDQLLKHLDYSKNLNNTYNASSEIQYGRHPGDGSCCGFSGPKGLPTQENEVLYGAFRRGY